MDYKELHLAMIKFLTSELRALEGTAILNEMELNTLPSEGQIRKCDSIDELMKLIESVKKSSNLIEQMYKSEGSFEAYKKVLNFISKFEENAK